MRVQSFNHIKGKLNCHLIIYTILEMKVNLLTDLAYRLNYYYYYCCY